MVVLAVSESSCKCNKVECGVPTVLTVRIQGSHLSCHTWPVLALMRASVPAISFCASMAVVLVTDSGVSDNQPSVMCCTGRMCVVRI